MNTEATNTELMCGLMDDLKSNGQTSNSLNDLHDVFSKITVKEDKSNSNDVDSLLLNSDVLLPLPMMSTQKNENLVSTPIESRSKSRLSDLDKLSEDLIKEQLEAINGKKALITKPV